MLCEKLAAGPGGTGQASLQEEGMSTVVPQEVRDLPLNALDLPPRIRQVLWRADLRSVGELADALATGRLATMRNLGVKSIAAIASALDAAVQEPGLVVKRAAELEMPWLATIDPGERPVNLLRHLGPLAKALWEHMVSQWGGGGTAYTVMRERYGLDGSKGHVLWEIGAGLGVSRQRVHQIHARALRQLREVLVGGRPPLGARVPAAMVAEAQEIARIVRAGGVVWREDELIELFSRRYRTPVKGATYGALQLLLDTLGLRRRRAPRAGHLPEPYWYWPNSGLSVARLDRAVMVVADILREDEGPRSLAEIQSEANRRRSGSLTREYARCALRLNGCIESVGPDVYQMRFECLSSHSKRACRILREQGAPMRLTELALEINRRLATVGDAPRSIKSVRQHMVRDPRIVSFGRGKWGLEVWRSGPPQPSNTGAS